MKMWVHIIKLFSFHHLSEIQGMWFGVFNGGEYRKSGNLIQLAGEPEGSQRQHNLHWAPRDAEGFALEGQKEWRRGKKGAGKNLPRGSLASSRPNVLSVHPLKARASGFPSEYWRGEIRAGGNGGCFIEEASQTQRQGPLVPEVVGVSWALLNPLAWSRAQLIGNFSLKECSNKMHCLRTLTSLADLQKKEKGFFITKHADTLNPRANLHSWPWKRSQGRRFL